MSIISFKKNCRSCNRTNGIDNMLNDPSNDSRYYKNFTEYEISQIIVDSLKARNSRCEFCHEFNFDINEVKVDGYKIYDFNRLVENYNNTGTEVFMLYFEKKNNIVTADIGGNDDSSNEFLRLCRDKGRSKIYLLGDECIEHNDGILFICFTGNGTYAKIEKFRHIGFSHVEIIGRIATAYRDLYI